MEDYNEMLNKTSEEFKAALNVLDSIPAMCGILILARMSEAIDNKLKELKKRNSAELMAALLHMSASSYENMMKDDEDDE